MDATEWPREPYRGLDFYHESDAGLFRERDDDVRACTEWLLSYGLKILLLQGSSGSGKSSFLRAGLIPAVRREDSKLHFLGPERVIRCTSDPMRKIAETLLAALDADAVFAKLPKRPTVRGRIEGALSMAGQTPATEGAHINLARILIDEFVTIGRYLPVTLVLVLDQAEEVLTRTTGSQHSKEEARAFFQFLEDVYVLNVDVRVIVSLRTEFYGRFRDEFGIQDKRMSDRPKEGGIAAYLLRPLRDEAALKRVIEAPTIARRKDGKLVYDFEFAPGLVEKIVHDLVSWPELGDASVTPALQLICADLYKRLGSSRRTIVSGDYIGIELVLRAYVDKGIQSIVGDEAKAGQGSRFAWARASVARLEQALRNLPGRALSATDHWLELLFTVLVSRQGGGTMVSLTEDAEAFIDSATEYKKHNRFCFGTPKDITRALRRLTEEPAPLLRGEPPDAPRNFSLKHDMLAIALNGRHFVLRDIREKARKRRGRWKNVRYVSAAAFAIVLSLIGWSDYQKARSFKDELDSSIRNATDPRNVDYLSSLQTMLIKLVALEHPQSYSYWASISDDTERQRNDTLQALRSVLSRAPEFSGQYLAAGIDPSSNKVALLGAKYLDVLSLPEGNNNTQPAQSSRFSFSPPDRRIELPFLRAAGFLTGMGPAAMINGTVIYLEGNTTRSAEVWRRLPSKFLGFPPPRIEFVGGKLAVVKSSFPETLSELETAHSQWKDLRLGENEIKSAAPIDNKMEETLPELKPFRPPPLLSNRFYAALDEDPGANPVSGGVAVELKFGEVGKEATPRVIQVGTVPPHATSEGQQYSFAFVNGSDMAVVKDKGGTLTFYDLASANTEAHGPMRTLEVTDFPKTLTAAETTRSASAAGWLNPPLAAARSDGKWLTAWPNDDTGVWAVAAEDAAATARPIVAGPLISGEKGGRSLLMFTHDGSHLMLLQHQFPGPVKVRIWDLRPGWIGWIEKGASEPDVVNTACRILFSAGHREGSDDGEGTSFRASDQFRRILPEPCEARAG